jgi:hypothetical protein
MANGYARAWDLVQPFPVVCIDNRHRRTPHAQLALNEWEARVPSGAVMAGATRFSLKSYHSNPIPRRWEASFLGRETLLPRGYSGILQ